VNCEQGRNLWTYIFLACACLAKFQMVYVYTILTFFNEPTLSVSMMETFCDLGGIFISMTTYGHNEINRFFVQVGG